MLVVVGNNSKSFSGLGRARGIDFNYFVTVLPL